jgi:hypothetical protein
MANATGVMERQDLREMRVRALLAEVMNRLQQFIADANYREVEVALAELFSQDGVEVLTDNSRADLGLPPRDQKGWTSEELVAFERLRLERLTQPMHHFVPLGVKE